MGACWAIKLCKEKVKVKSKVAILGFIMQCDSIVPALDKIGRNCRAAPRRVWNFWWWQAGTRQHMQGPQVEVRKFQKKCKSDISGRGGGCASASTRIYYQEKL